MEIVPTAMTWFSRIFKYTTDIERFRREHPDITQLVTDGPVLFQLTTDELKSELNWQGGSRTTPARYRTMFFHLLKPRLFNSSGSI